MLGETLSFKMNITLQEYYKFPVKERFFILEKLISKNFLSIDEEIIKKILENTNTWFEDKKELKNVKSINDIPDIYNTIYDIYENITNDFLLPKSLDKDRKKVNKLTDDEKSYYVEQIKLFCINNSEIFKKYIELQENYKIDPILKEFIGRCPTDFIEEYALKIYKKCISYKDKITKKGLKNLNYSSDTKEYWFYNFNYCIDKEIVFKFLRKYQKWRFDAISLWNECSKERGYNNLFEGWNTVSNWKFYLKHEGALSEKVNLHLKFQNEIKNSMSLAIQILDECDNFVSNEYCKNSYDISHFEREIELEKLKLESNENELEYCYVYVLECPIGVFYVGIASNPQERFEQHLRGALSDEAHLFKSKFIQKYKNDIKLKIIDEGLRKECKSKEKEYILKNNPLGNMTEGGEG